MKKKYSLLFVTVLTLFLGCQNSKTPSEKAAWDFVDTYYVRTDPVAALPFTDRLAYEKVKQSVDLIQSLASQPGNETHTRPKVSASLLSSPSENSQDEPFVFKIIITPYGSQEIRKKVMVRVRSMENKKWKVTQFSDQDVLENVTH